MRISTTTGIYGGKEKAIGIYQIDTLYQININKLFSDLKKRNTDQDDGIEPQALEEPEVRKEAQREHQPAVEEDRQER